MAKIGNVVEIKGLTLFEADFCIVRVFGEHVNSNDGKKRDSGVAYETFWGIQWNIFVRRSKAWCQAPKGKCIWNLL